MDFVIDSTAEEHPGTSLDIVSDPAGGKIIGGDGYDANGYKDGAPGVDTDNSTEKGEITVEEGVTIQGGKGADSTTATAATAETAEAAKTLPEPVAKAAKAATRVKKATTVRKRQQAVEEALLWIE